MCKFPHNDVRFLAKLCDVAIVLFKKREATLYFENTALNMENGEHLHVIWTNAQNDMKIK